MRLLGKAYDALQQPDEALVWYQKAAAEAPGTREPWHDLSLAYYTKRRWQECLDAAEKGLEIKEKQLVYTCDPRVWEEPLYDLASVAAWNLGLKEKALDYCETAAKIAPSDARIAANLTMMQKGNQ
jgi:tetratricopeptide (TPR) repeat protein